MTRLLSSLRSPGAMMIALVLALFPQGEHTAQVFLHFSHDSTGNAQLFAYAFAAAVEVAVLLFVLAGHKGISYTFAIASFLTNIVYYSIGGVALTIFALPPVLLLSALLPGCIMGYSHTIAKHGAAHATATDAQPRQGWQFWRKAEPSDDVHNTHMPQHDVKTPLDATQGHIAAVSEVATETPVLDARTRALQLNKEGLTVAQIAAEVNVNVNTIRSWLRRAASSNGVRA